ncbi:MAG: ATP-dependent Clp protease proteolytic subunit [Chlamydiia bacterium]|nr:ATP-dependent Clp protease proteolytic subunit [Chlamydiia bacterium]
MGIIPYVIEETGKGERSVDIYSRLLLDRIIIIGDDLNDQAVNVLIAQLLFLANDSSKDIHIYINLKAGSLSAGLSLFDAIKYVEKKCDVCTLCIGQASSVGALVLASGTKGKRIALPNSRIMIHQPHGYVTGTSAEIQLQAREIKMRKEMIIKVLSICTGKSQDNIRADIDRDFFMGVKEAIEYGIIDSVCGDPDLQVQEDSLEKVSSN